MNRIDIFITVISCLFGLLLLASSSSADDAVTGEAMNSTEAPGAVTGAVTGAPHPADNMTTAMPEQQTTAGLTGAGTAPAQKLGAASDRSPVFLTAVGVAFLSIIFILNQSAACI